MRGRGIVIKWGSRYVAVLGQRGATSWGFQIGRLYMNWPYLHFLRVGCHPTIGWDKD